MSEAPASVGEVVHPEPQPSKVVAMNMMNMVNNQANRQQSLVEDLVNNQVIFKEGEDEEDVVHEKIPSRRDMDNIVVVQQSEIVVESSVVDSRVNRETNGNGHNGNNSNGNNSNGNDTTQRKASGNGTDVLDANPMGDKSANMDQNDAWGFGGRRSPMMNVVRMPVDKDSETYNMDHKRRGLALIFNHMHFDHRMGLRQRNGTNADRDNLQHTLRALDFEVRVYNDLTFKEVESLLEKASQSDHSDADCIFVSVMSHGELGILYASDQPYKPDRLWSHFNAERCPSLAGKPKMFFIQACQGDQLDGGVHMKRVTHRHETDSNALTYKIPAHADFLIAYSTIPGFYSWRNTTAGSWFVQALCEVLRREADRRDLLSIMTRVARKVAFDFQSNTPGDYMMHEKKQIPCISSMLTRDIYFKPKSAHV